MLTMTLEDFAYSFGTTIDDIPEESRVLINSKDFNYEIIEGSEKDKIILNIINRIESDQQIVGATERKDVWQKGWDENLQEFIVSDYDPEALIPKFIRPGQPMRFNREFILSSNHMLELDFFRVFRIWLFKKYLNNIDSVYEFGCGTGFNLVELARLYPDKKLFGLDFVPASRDLVNKLGKSYNLNLTGDLFDMINPNEEIHLYSNSAVMTFGSIEQLAGKFEYFLQYILKQAPAICINMEPTIELYDENHLLDYLAIKFHKKRGYTIGYLPRLQQLEEEGKIEILKVKRLFFGSMFMEGFTYMVWRPREKVL